MNKLLNNRLAILFFLLTYFLSFSQNSYYKSLGKNYVKMKGQGEIGDMLIKAYKEKPVEQIRLIDKAYNLTKIRKDSTLLPYIYFHYAIAHGKLSDDANELKYLNKIIKLVDWDTHNFLLSRVYSYIGFTHHINGNYDKAIENQLKILKNTKSEKLKANANSNIASLYIENKKYDFAKPHIDEVFKYYIDNTKEGKDNKNLAFEYLFLSHYTDKYLEKVKLVNKGIKLTELRSNENKIYAYEFRAKLYSSYEKYDLAITDYKSALKLINENQFTYLASNIYHALANLYSKQNYPHKSLSQLDSARKYIMESDLKLKKENAEITSRVYSKIGEFEKAFFYAKELIEYQDSIFNKSKDSLYIAYGTKYQTEKKIKENQILKKENQIKDLEVSKQITTRNYLILFSILGIVALGATYSRFKAKKKTANLLAEQNTIINQQKEELEKSNANKQKLFGIIAHDLVNPFNAILGYTQLLDDDYNNFTDSERKAFISTINKYANSNYNLTRTLLDWAKVQQDRLVVNKAKLSCKDIVVNAIQPYQVLADKKNITITTNIPEDKTIEADQNMMQTVIGNLFVNAIKFTPEGGTITLNLEKLNGGTINLEIEDNGIGMTHEQLNNLFDITKATTIKGTNNEKGNGLGLILCKELVELQKGTLQIFSKLNKGSKAVVTI